MRCTSWAKSALIAGYARPVGRRVTGSTCRIDSEATTTVLGHVSSSACTRGAQRRPIASRPLDLDYVYKPNPAAAHESLAVTVPRRRDPSVLSAAASSKAGSRAALFRVSSGTGKRTRCDRVLDLDRSTSTPDGVFVGTATRGRRLDEIAPTSRPAAPRFDEFAACQISGRDDSASLFGRTYSVAG
jgi:hypothetical protein